MKVGVRWKKVKKDEAKNTMYKIENLKLKRKELIVKNQILKAI
jgi:hypothetical protein